MKSEENPVRQMLENIVGVLFGGSLVVAYIAGAFFVIFYLLFSITLLYNWISILDVGRGILGLLCFVVTNIVGILVLGVIVNNMKSRITKIGGFIFGAGFLGVYIWVIITYFFAWLSNLLPWQGYVAELVFIIVNVIVSFGVLLTTNVLKDFLIRKE
ncbi:MAG: hypothetical protein ACXABK_03180 [Candidatus Heimdallarchaeaceae archaeon]